MTIRTIIKCDNCPNEHETPHLPWNEREVDAEGTLNNHRKLVPGWIVLELDRMEASGEEDNETNGVTLRACSETCAAALAASAYRRLDEADAKDEAQRQKIGEAKRKAGIEPDPDEGRRRRRHRR